VLQQYTVPSHPDIIKISNIHQNGQPIGSLRRRQREGVAHRLLVEARNEQCLSPVRRGGNPWRR
jgi:hypothetical protein